jgi:hypothetical protein
MKTKLSLRKPALVITLALVLSLLVSVTAFAQTADEAIVQLFRLGGNYAGVKITFPNDITNAKYLVMIAGKGFDCVITPPNVAYCIGVYPRSTGPSILHLIDLETKETILKRAVYPPVPKGFGIQEVELDGTSTSRCSCR